jgi:hypothetical protein
MKMKGFLFKLGQDAVRATLYGVIILVLLIGASKITGDMQAEAVKYQKAVACELAIPSDPDTGRDPLLVSDCFVAEGLQPPRFVET